MLGGECLDEMVDSSRLSNEVFFLPLGQDQHGAEYERKHDRLDGKQHDVVSLVRLLLVHPVGNAGSARWGIFEIWRHNRIYQFASNQIT